MSTHVDTTVSYRTSAHTPTVPDYRTLVEMPAGRLLMPATATVHVDIDGDPTLSRVILDVELLDRRYQVTRMELVTPPGAGLDVQAVTKLDLPSFIRAGVAHLIRMESTDGDVFTHTAPMTDPDPLWPVALTYSVAHVLGESPTAAVASHLRISKGAAAQRVSRARAAGYLPPTMRGKAS